MDIQISMVSFDVLKNCRKAKEYAGMALRAAQSGDLDIARSLLEQTEALNILAETAARKLREFDLTGKEYLQQHSYNHLANSQLSVDLVRELVSSYA